jgi:hypothetical protein
VLAAAVVLLALKAWVIADFGNPTPFWDQWDAEAELLYKPYLEGTLRLEDLFRAHNEHRIFTTRLLDLALLEINGGWNPLLQMLVNAALHGGGIIGIALLAARACGARSIRTLLLFSVALFGIPYGWENILCGFQSQFYLVLIFGVACVWLTTAKAPFSMGWWAGFAAGLLAHWSLASGVFATAAAGIVLLVSCLRSSPRSTRRLLAAILLLLFAAIGYLATPLVPEHAEFHPQTLAQLLTAIDQTFAWPVKARWSGAIVRNAPALLFAIWLWRRRPRPDGAAWGLLGLVLWTLGQSLGVAYGRGAAGLAPRHLDMLAVALLSNFACAIFLVQVAPSVHKRSAAIAAIAWSALMLGILIPQSIGHLPRQLALKREQGLAQQQNLQAYLQTGDVATLEAQPLMMLPYPDADRLVQILQSDTIRGILPESVWAGSGKQARVGQFDPAVEWFLRHHLALLVSGLVFLAGALVREHLASRPRTAAAD